MTVISLEKRVRQRPRFAHDVCYVDDECRNVVVLRSCPALECQWLAIVFLNELNTRHWLHHGVCADLRTFEYMCDEDAVILQFNGITDTCMNQCQLDSLHAKVQLFIKHYLHRLPPPCPPTLPALKPVYLWLDAEAAARLYVHCDPAAAAAAASPSHVPLPLKPRSATFSSTALAAQAAPAAAKPPPRKRARGAPRRVV